MNCTAYQLYSGDQIKKNEIGGNVAHMGREELYVGF
jgi:hypothetical protein